MLTLELQVDILCTELAPGKPVTMRVHPANGETFDIKLNQTFNEAQIEWFKNGSALNTMAKMSKN
jgi:aconitate hydratase